MVSCQEDALSPGLEDEPEDPEEDEDGRRYPLVVKIAIENGPFIDDLPIKHGDFLWLC